MGFRLPPEGCRTTSRKAADESAQLLEQVEEEAGREPLDRASEEAVTGRRARRPLRRRPARGAGRRAPRAPRRSLEIPCSAANVVERLLVARVRARAPRGTRRACTRRRRARRARPARGLLRRRRGRATRASRTGRRPASARRTRRPGRGTRRCTAATRRARRGTAPAPHSPCSRARARAARAPQAPAPRRAKNGPENASVTARSSWSSSAPAATGTRPCPAVLERGGDVGHLPFGSLDLDEHVLRDAELVERRDRLSSTAAAPAPSASSWFRSSAAAKTGESRSRPTTTPAWREAIVQPPCTTCADRPASARSVSATSVSPRPAPTRICGGTVQPQPARGQQRQRSRDRRRPARRPAPAAATTPPTRRREPSGGDRSQRHHRDDEPGGRRRHAPAVRRAAARAGRAPPTSPPERSSSARFAPTCGRRRSGTRSPCEAAQRRDGDERKRRLEQEDPLPAERLREDAAGGGAEGRAERCRRPPRRGPPRRRFPPLPASRSSAAAITSAPPAACTQRAPTRRLERRAPGRRRSEAAAKTSVPATKATAGRRRARIGGRHRSEREHEVVRRQHPRDRRDLDVEPGSTSGSASVTTDESASARPIARPSSPERHACRQLRRSRAAAREQRFTTTSLLGFRDSSA